MPEGTEYILKNKEKIKGIGVGKAKISIGNKNNKLTVCDRAPNTKSKKTRVICLCDCGKYTVINYQDFKSGKVKSCGCLSNELKAERCKKTAINFSSKDKNINPFYEYIRPTERRENHQVVWEIKCRKCGKHYFAAPGELIGERNHRSNPCQCWKKYSIGVQKIINILNENNIEYEMEKKFDTCLSQKSFVLPFDFFLTKENILIEYDGEQHFKICFGQTEEKLKKQKENDFIKNSWCLKNNIPLIRIPYTHLKDLALKDLLLKTTTFLIKSEDNINE